MRAISQPCRHFRLSVVELCNAERVLVQGLGLLESSG